jgi:alkaline phosphatase
MGKATGIVSNTYVQDATPGVWAAHWHSRSGRPVAAQQADAGLESLLGSGSYYMTSDPPGSRTDGRNLIEEMIADGYIFAETRDQLDAAVVGPEDTGLLGIFGSIWTMTYVLDRFQDPDLSHSPTLLQMVEKAMDVLDGRSNNGFFLVIEGAYSDWLGHNLDFPGLVAETLEFEEAVQAVLDRFGGDGETLIVTTADHETGGLVVEGAPPVYDREFVDSIECTADYMYGQVMNQNWDGVDIVSACFPQGGVTVEEVDAAIAACPNSEIGLSRLMASKAGGVEFYQTRQDEVPWDNCDEGSHTLTRVNVYAAGPGAEQFDDISDNTQIGQALHRLVCGTWPCP